MLGHAQSRGGHVMAPVKVVAVAVVLVAGLAGCAAKGAPRAGAGIEYRNSSAGSSSRVGTVTSGERVEWTGATGDLSKVSSSPAVQEAAAMRPETRGRPGGARRLPADDPAKRAVRVQRGDSLYEISRRYSANLRALIETNNLRPPYGLEPGQVVYLPPPNIHVVERGETVYSVSRRYNVDTRSLAIMNGLERPWTVWPGDELRLPALARDEGWQPRRVAAAPVAPARPAASSSGGAPVTIRPGGTSREERMVAQNPVGPANFIWPVTGQVLKGFGDGADGLKNDGVNIAAATGTEVVATADGEVVYAGDELTGFGNLVLVSHSGGWVSAYAHADSLLVSEGQAVKQGQAIARAGSTGLATESQVHFELRQGQKVVDPGQYLPKLTG